MEGFGEKSYENLRKRIENARKTTLPRLIYSLGIPNIGISNAKMICRALGEDPKRVIRATEEELSAISGVGGVIAGTFVEYFKDTAHVDVFDRLLKEVELTKETSEDMDATDGLAAAYCHYLQMGRPTLTKEYSGWKDFINKNPDKIKR